MKIKPGYILREIMDIYMIMGVGSEAYSPNEILSLNETGAFLWRILEKGAEKPELAAALQREYDTDPQTAERDVDVFLEMLRGKALIDG
ncbi:MAG: PqqD family protein [Clostridia bacterium]|nr:PqqD family protein [Clostridia bacterium]MCR4886695.1 PqqD family protein [Clostridiales bacterium]